MTEAEWLACNDPTAMLEFLRDGANDRGLWVFIVACSRRVLPEHLTVELKRLLDVIDAYIDGKVSREEMLRVAARGMVATINPSHLANHAVRFSQRCAALSGSGSTAPECASLIRDIFGNPFRPIAAEPQWLTSDVLALARGIYEERAFDRMPILADALQDAGCDNADVLDHCRDPNGVHVRGCWVVDLLLGKS